MKNKNYLNYRTISISCTCGALYKIKTTKNYKIDICCKCHPFFTGEKKILDTEGRIEKFKKKYKINAK